MNNTNKLRSLLRMTNVSHLLTVLLLTAVGAALLLPLSAHSADQQALPSAARHNAATVTPGASVSQPTATTSIPTTTVPAVVTTPTTVPAPAPVPAPVPAPAAVAVAAVPSGYGCGPAIAYLQAHAAPGFAFQCPGYAEGHQAMTCDNVAGVCSGTKVIAISTPCPAAYMNEASNSWVVLGESHASLDPYGYCH
jgi:hypothetical protein